MFIKLGCKTSRVKAWAMEIQKRCYELNQKYFMADTNKQTCCCNSSSRALFDLDESNLVYEQQGIEAYLKYQVANEDKIVEPGGRFPPS